MCKITKKVRVKILADLSHSGRSYWKECQIDACIADIVMALQNGGINMRHSCCGHDKGPGDIILEDGIVLTITKPKAPEK